MLLNPPPRCPHEYSYSNTRLIARARRASRACPLSTADRVRSTVGRANEDESRSVFCRPLADSIHAFSLSPAAITRACKTTAVNGGARTTAFPSAAPPRHPNLLSFVSSRIACNTCVRFPRSPPDGPITKRPRSPRPTTNADDINKSFPTSPPPKLSYYRFRRFFFVLFAFPVR